MIMIYDMSTGIFETDTEKCAVENPAGTLVTPEVCPVIREPDLQEVPVEAAPDSDLLTPELATINSDAFLRSMEK